MFEHPGHPRELWDLTRAAKYARESESDFKIVPTGPKLQKMKKSGPPTPAKLAKDMRQHWKIKYFTCKNY